MKRRMVWFILTLVGIALATSVIMAGAFMQQDYVKPDTTDITQTYDFNYTLSENANCAYMADEHHMVWFAYGNTNNTISMCVDTCRTTSAKQTDIVSISVSQSVIEIGDMGYWPIERDIDGLFKLSFQTEDQFLDGQDEITLLTVESGHYYTNISMVANQAMIERMQVGDVAVIEINASTEYWLSAEYYIPFDERFIIEIIKVG